jgi:hypothetical protein
MSPLPGGIPGSREGTPQGVNPVTHRLVDGKPVRRPIEDAKRLLAEAGYPDGRDAATGRPLVINYDYYAPATPERKPEIDWMVRQFAKIWASSSRCAPPTTTSSRTRCAGQAPDLLERLAGRLPGCRELPVPALRAQRKSVLGRREHGQLRECRVRRAVPPD